MRSVALLCHFVQLLVYKFKVTFCFQDAIIVQALQLELLLQFVMSTTAVLYTRYSVPITLIIAYLAHLIHT